MKKFLVNNQQQFIIILACLIASIGYISWSTIQNGFGFPLDDSWIHLTYARNLAEYGTWTFQSGDITAGSTSPLWTLLLAVAFKITSEPFIGTYLLGMLSLIGLGISCYKLINKYSNNKSSAIYFTLFIVSEWHMIWATTSGMETIFYCFLMVLIFLFISSLQTKYWIWAGAITGLAIWTRPDALLVGIPVGFFWLLKSRKFELFLAYGLGLLPILGGYLIFNLTLSGNIWPNTLYAKHAEYAELLNVNIFQRLWNVIKPPFIGPGIILVPGIIFTLVSAVRKNNVFILSLYSWWIAFFIIYAIFLPVSYQYGRYLMPIIPIVLFCGLIGTQDLLQMIQKKHLFNIIRFGLIALIAGVVGSFYIQGAMRYSQDVSIINNEMVQTSVWISQNTPVDSRIGAHDIGALGYFGNRQIIDLAGLINPEVISIISDENALANYLNINSVNYLMCFPDWYESLTENLIPIYQSSEEIMANFNLEPMTVYIWQ